VVDLPGCYSLTAYSLDEVVARDYIIEEKPDVVVHIVDASNLERNLYLSTQLMELGCPLVIALNMMDVAEKRGDSIDTERLAEFLEIPVVKTIGSVGYGIHTLMHEVLREAARGGHHEHEVGYGKETERLIVELEGIVKKAGDELSRYPPRWLAVKLLENDANIRKKLEASSVRAEVEAFLGNVDTEEMEAHMADKRYEVINVVLRQVQRRAEEKMSGSDMVDHVFTHKYLGIPLFLILMWGAFELTFRFAAPFMDGIDWLFAQMIGWVHDNVEPAWLASLIGDGILGGVGFVIIFIPNIFILFFILSVLEDSGYLARAAFLMDRLMYKMGLHGRSFIPLLMGFGCTIPAIMATRTIEDENDRLTTILINPFISCGARLPVYLLLAGAFFGSRASAVIFLVYIMGILTAIFSAKLLRSTVLKGKPAPFIMELPPYRLPTLRTSMLHTWERGREYLKKAGTFILGAAIIIWFLTSFNAGGYIEETEKDIDRDELVVGEGSFEGTGWFMVLEDGEGMFTGTLLEDVDLERENGTETYTAGEELTNLTLKENERIHARGVFQGNCEFLSDENGGVYTGSDFTAEESFAADIGRSFEPATAPMGFNWKMNTALVFGFAAKEMVVGSLGVLYGVGEDQGRLTDTLSDDEDFTPLVAFSLMVFVLTYVPCVATVAVIFKETRSLKWTSFSVGYSLVLAWVFSLVIYQLGSLLGY